MDLIDTYLFDLDDTIIDSSIYSRMYGELIREITGPGKIPAIQVQKEIGAIKEETGKEKIDSFELCRRLGCIELYYGILEKYAKHTYSLKTPAIPKVFQKIKENKKRIGIVSNSQERTIQVFLDRFNISGFTDFIESGKKDTVLFWVMLEKRHSIDKATAMLIDDSEEILKIAEHAGYKVLNVKDLDKIAQFKL